MIRHMNVMHQVLDVDVERMFGSVRPFTSLLRCYARNCIFCTPSTRVWRQHTLQHNMAGNSAAGAVSRQALAGALSEDDSRRLRTSSYMDPVPLLRPYSMRSFTRTGAEQGAAVPLPRKLAEAVASDPGVIEVPDVPELPRGELELYAANMPRGDSLSPTEVREDATEEAEAQDSTPARPSTATRPRGRPNRRPNRAAGPRDATVPATANATPTRRQPPRNARQQQLVARTDDEEVESEVDMVLSDGRLVSRKEARENEHYTNLHFLTSIQYVEFPEKKMYAELPVELAVKHHPNFGFVLDLSVDAFRHVFVFMRRPPHAGRAAIYHGNEMVTRACRGHPMGEEGYDFRFPTSWRITGPVYHVRCRPWQLFHKVCCERVPVEGIGHYVCKDFDVVEQVLVVINLPNRRLI